MLISQHEPATFRELLRNMKTAEQSNELLSLKFIRTPCCGFHSQRTFVGATQTIFFFTLMTDQGFFFLFPLFQATSQGKSRQLNSFASFQCLQFTAKCVATWRNCQPPMHAFETDASLMWACSHRPMCSIALKECVSLC